MLIHNQQLYNLCWNGTLTTKHVKYYLSTQNITEEEFIALSSTQQSILNDGQVYALIANGVLPFKRALNLTDEVKLLIDSPVYEYLIKKLLKVDDILKMTKEQVNILTKRGVYYALEKGYISFQDIISQIKTSDSKLLMDEDRLVISMDRDRLVKIEEHEISLMRLLNLPWYVIEQALRCPAVNDWLRRGMVTLDEILIVSQQRPEHSTYDEEQRLICSRDPYHESYFPTRCVNEGIKGQKLTATQVLQLSYYGYLNLTYMSGGLRNFNDPNDGLRKCIEEEIFTVQEFIEIPNWLSNEEQLSLKNPEIRAEIREIRERTGVAQSDTSDLYYAIVTAASKPKGLAEEPLTGNPKSLVTEGKEPELSGKKSSQRD